MTIRHLTAVGALVLFIATTLACSANAQALFAQQPPGARNPLEFTRGPYLVTIQFRGGIASEITIRRAQSNSRVRPDLNVAAEFAPAGFAIAGAHRNGRDPPGQVDYYWWEWDSNFGGRPITVRFHSQSYLRANPSIGNEIGDLADMRWSFRTK
jgi:hypothetical protein